MSESPGTVAVIGAGTIGLSWTVLFAANGWTVRVQDPRPDLKQVVRDGLEQFAPALREPADAAELAERVHNHTELARAVDGVDVVQENGPERIEFKREVFGELEQSAPDEALLSSSTSGLQASDIARDLGGGGARMLVAHPFNPPHLLPLVEIVPGQDTDPGTVDRAVQIYRSVGKHPVVLRAESSGFVANRLQSALFREAVDLVLRGVVTPGELDTVVTEALGPRWATAGPFLSYHLGGGPGGFRHFLEHLGPGMAARWKDLGAPELTPQVVEELARLAEQDLPEADYERLTASRDRQERAVLRAREHPSRSGEERPPQHHDTARSQHP